MEITPPTSHVHVLSAGVFAIPDNCFSSMCAVMPQKNEMRKKKKKKCNVSAWPYT